MELNGGSTSRNGNHGYGGQVPISSRQHTMHHHHVAMAMRDTPAPSDISSIQPTPRQVTTPSEKGMSVNHGAPDTPQTFLAPAPVSKDMWPTYKVLPSVGHGGDSASVPVSEMSERHPSAMSHNGSSINCLSPFLDFSPPESNHNQRKRRAMSTSTLSSGSFNIMDMIRCSPTVLHQIGQSRGSPSSGSMHLGSQHGTGINYHHGAMGHCVRSSGSNSLSGSAQAGMRHNVMREMDNSQLEMMIMASLEANCVHHPEMPMVDVSNNQMVITQNFVDQLQFVRPSDSAMGYASPAPNIAGQQQAMHETGNYEAAMMPPPPPYPNNMRQQHHAQPQQPPQQQRQQQQQQQQPHLTQQRAQTYDALSPNTVTSENTEINDENSNDGSNFICKWIDCDQIFVDRGDMVQHIEKLHIDQRRGEDFTCYWQGCVRRYKPFNARYKLLIHMRVHSGEKPNKCTVSPSSSMKPVMRGHSTNASSHGRCPLITNFTVIFSHTIKFVGIS